MLQLLKLWLLEFSVGLASARGRAEEYAAPGKVDLRTRCRVMALELCAALQEQGDLRQARGCRGAAQGGE